MIRTKDLMINDWVILHDPDTDKKEFITITFSDLGNIIMNWIEPIKLTNEIMEKNFPDYEKGYEIGWWPNTDGSMHIEYLDGKCEIVIIEMHYLHELQHLLKLVGSEKVINP